MRVTTNKVPIIVLLRCDVVKRADPGSNKPGPAFTKRRPTARSCMELTYVTPSTSRATSRTASPASVHSSSDGEGLAGGASKRPEYSRRHKKFVFSFLSEEKPPRKSRETSN